MITGVAITLSIPLLLILPFLKGEGRLTMLFLIYGYCAGLVASVLLDPGGFLVSGDQYTDIGAGPVIEGALIVAPVIAAGVLAPDRVGRGLLGCAMASGFGFSIVETLVMIISLQVTGPEAAVLAAARSASSSVMHGSVAALVGWGLVLLAGMPRKTLFPVVFGIFTMSVTLHALYNLFMGYIPGGLVPGLLLPWAIFVLLLFSFHGGFHDGVSGGKGT